jgi:hypothetical protein
MADYQNIGSEDKGGYEGYQGGGYPPVGGSGFVGGNEHSGLLANQHGGYQGFGNSEDDGINQVLADNKAALAVYTCFTDLNAKFLRTLWLWPIVLTVVQLVSYPKFFSFQFVLFLF